MYFDEWMNVVGFIFLPMGTLVNYGLEQKKNLSFKTKIIIIILDVYIHFYSLSYKPNHFNVKNLVLHFHFPIAQPWSYLLGKKTNLIWLMLVQSFFLFLVGSSCIIIVLGIFHWNKKIGQSPENFYNFLFLSKIRLSRIFFFLVGGNCLKTKLTDY